MAAVLIDTDVFIRIFKGDDALEESVLSIDAAINTVVYLELIQGATKSRAEIREIEDYLLQFELIHLDNRICLTTIRLVRTYGNSHNLRLADALIAATALENNLELLTYNVKDFDFIAGLKLNQQS
jgi:predicted nucleic acid-binding protein